MAKAKKEKETGMVVTEDRPSYLAEVDDNSARGQENVGIEDVVIPRVDVIQSLSPQRKKNDPAYIEGAEEGMLFNPVTQALYGESLFFVPVYFRKEFVVWKDRKLGGGFSGAFATEVEAVNHANELGEGHEVMDTGQHFGLVVHDDGSVESVVISMSRSKMKASRNLNTLVKLAGGDRFSRVYKLIAFSDQNNAGEDFFNIKFDQLGYPSEAVYRLAEKMYDDVSTGVRDVSREDAPKAEAESTDY